MSDLCLSPAVELARLVADGQLSAAELVQAHLDRIDRVNPRLNALVDVRADAALAEARAQDAAAARGVPRGPLGGVPVTVKSAIEVAGLRCETGSPARRGIVATQDAVVVSRLRAAGAIVLGTTNVAEMLMAYESDNPLHGRTISPWDPSRTPGGSSGGEAAAIAAGCSAGGIGSDGGGSIRVPAHFSGICGLKPTPGRIPATGHQPPCLGPFSVIGCVGPMARTVADVQQLFDVLTGWDDVDPYATPLAAGGSASLAGTTVAVFEDDGEHPVTAGTQAAVRAAAQALSDAGLEVTDYRPPALSRARALWDVFFAETGALLLGETLAGAERNRPSCAPIGRPIRHAPADRRAPRARLDRSRPGARRAPSPTWRPGASSSCAPSPPSRRSGTASGAGPSTGATWVTWTPWCTPSGSTSSATRPPWCRSAWRTGCLWAYRSWAGPTARPRCWRCRVIERAAGGREGRPLMIVN
ncbi:MAG: amidase [Vicinamibacterales bacterium]